MYWAFEDLSGGYCSGVPPLPIPNREVKPACADGTAMQCGRVGGRPLFTEYEAPDQKWSGASSCHVGKVIFTWASWLALSQKLWKVLGLSFFLLTFAAKKVKLNILG